MYLKKIKSKGKKSLKLKGRSFCGEATCRKLVKNGCFGMIEMIVLGDES